MKEIAKNNWGFTYGPATLPIYVATDPDRAGCHHPARMWIVARKVEAWGHFLVARIAGTRDPHDYRLPKAVPYVPKDAVELPSDIVEAYWHDDSRGIPKDLCDKARANAQVWDLTRRKQVR